MKERGREEGRYTCTRHSSRTFASLKLSSSVSLLECTNFTLSIDCTQPYSEYSPTCSSLLDTGAGRERERGAVEREREGGKEGGKEGGGRRRRMGGKRVGI